MLAVACAAPSAQSPPDAPSAAAVEQTVVVSLIGTTDIHGRVDTLPLLAGYVERIRELRQSDGGMLLFDSGDMFQGTLESNLEEGRVVFQAFAAMGYDAVALGNHEFDYGPVGNSATGAPFGALQARILEAPFPVLAANLVMKADATPPPWRGLAPSAMLEVAGVRVGVVGALTEETPKIVMPGYFVGLDVISMADRVAAEAAQLRAAGAKLVVALAHAGGECEAFDDPRDTSSCKPNSEVMTLARELPKGSVDVIFGGHTHQAVAHFVEGIAVTQAFAHGRALSRVDVVFRSGSAPQVTILAPRTLCQGEGEVCSAGTYEGATIVPDAGIARLIAGAQARAAAVRSAAVGVTVTGTVRRSYGRESDLGNLLTDLLLEAVPGARVALMNGGGLRADLPPGELSYGQLYEVMPFDNRVTTFELSGAELRDVIRRHLENGKHGILSVAGLRVSAHCQPAGVLRVNLMSASGKPIRDDERFVVVTSDYLATGGDALFAGLDVSARMSVDGELTLRDAFARALAARKTLTAEDPTRFSVTAPRLKLPGPRPVRCE